MGNLWDNEVKHNEEAEWLQKVKISTRNVPEQAEVVITRKTLKQQLSKMPEWKSSGSDGVHGHWLKSFTTLHDTMVQQLGEILTSGEVPSWMVNGRTTLIVKDKTKGNLV